MLVVFHLSELLRCLRKRTVSQRVLHVVCNRLFMQVARNISVLHAEVLTSVRPEGRFLHCLERQLFIEAFEILEDSICHRRDAWISDHAVGLAAHEMPYRQLALLLIDMKHGIDEVHESFRLVDRVQRHSCAVCVPERESGIVGERLVVPYLIVRTAVVAVDVAVCRRSNHCMIQSCVEYLAGCLVCCLYAYSGEFLVPFLVGGFSYSIEIPAGILSHEILLCVLFAYRRETYLHHDLLSLCCLEVSLCVERHIVDAVDVEVCERP